MTGPPEYLSPRRPPLTRDQQQLLRLLEQAPRGAAPAALGPAMRPRRTAAAIWYAAAVLLERGLITHAAGGILVITAEGRRALARSR